MPIGGNGQTGSGNHNSEHGGGDDATSVADSTATSTQLDRRDSRQLSSTTTAQTRRALQSVQEEASRTLNGQASLATVAVLASHSDVLKGILRRFKSSMKDNLGIHIPMTTEQTQALLAFNMRLKHDSDFHDNELPLLAYLQEKFIPEVFSGFTENEITGLTKLREELLKYCTPAYTDSSFLNSLRWVKNLRWGTDYYTTVAFQPTGAPDATKAPGSREKSTFPEDIEAYVDKLFKSFIKGVPSFLKSHFLAAQSALLTYLLNRKMRSAKGKAVAYDLDYRVVIILINLRMLAHIAEIMATSRRPNTEWIYLMLLAETLADSVNSSNATIASSGKDSKSKPKEQAKSAEDFDQEMSCKNALKDVIKSLRMMRIHCMLELALSSTQEIVGEYITAANHCIDTAATLLVNFLITYEAQTSLPKIAIACTTAAAPTLLGRASLVSDELKKTIVKNPELASFIYYFFSELRKVVAADHDNKDLAWLLVEGTGLPKISKQQLPPHLKNILVILPNIVKQVGFLELFKLESALADRTVADDPASSFAKVNSVKMLGQCIIELLVSLKETVVEYLHEVDKVRGPELERISDKEKQLEAKNAKAAVLSGKGSASVQALDAALESAQSCAETLQDHLTSFSPKIQALLRQVFDRFELKMHQQILSGFEQMLAAGVIDRAKYDECVVPLRVALAGLQAKQAALPAAASASAAPALPIASATALEQQQLLQPESLDVSMASSAAAGSRAAPATSNFTDLFLGRACAQSQPEERRRRPSSAKSQSSRGVPNHSHRPAALLGQSAFFEEVDESQMEPSPVVDSSSNSSERERAQAATALAPSSASSPMHSARANTAQEPGEMRFHSRPIGVVSYDINHDAWCENGRPLAYNEAKTHFIDSAGYYLQAPNGELVTIHNIQLLQFTQQSNVSAVIGQSSEGARAADLETSSLGGSSTHAGSTTGMGGRRRRRMTTAQLERAQENEREQQKQHVKSQQVQQPAQQCQDQQQPEQLPHQLPVQPDGAAMLLSSAVMSKTVNFENIVFNPQDGNFYELLLVEASPTYVPLSIDQDGYLYNAAANYYLVDGQQQTYIHFSQCPAGLTAQSADVATSQSSSAPFATVANSSAASAQVNTRYAVLIYLDDRFVEQIGPDSCCEIVVHGDSDFVFGADGAVLYEKASGQPYSRSALSSYQTALIDQSCYASLQEGHTGAFAAAASAFSPEQQQQFQQPQPELLMQQSQPSLGATQQFPLADAAAPTLFGAAPDEINRELSVLSDTSAASGATLMPTHSSLLADGAQVLPGMVIPELTPGDTSMAFASSAMTVAGPAGGSQDSLFTLGGSGHESGDDRKQMPPEGPDAVAVETFTSSGASSNSSRADSQRASRVMASQSPSGGSADMSAADASAMPEGETAAAQLVRLAPAAAHVAAPENGVQPEAQQPEAQQPQEQLQQQTRQLEEAQDRPDQPQPEAQQPEAHEHQEQLQQQAQQPEEAQQPQEQLQQLPVANADASVALTEHTLRPAASHPADVAAWKIPNRVDFVLPKITITPQVFIAQTFTATAATKEKISDEQFERAFKQNGYQSLAFHENGILDGIDHDHCEPGLKAACELLSAENRNNEFFALPPVKLETSSSVQAPASEAAQEGIASAADAAAPTAAGDAPAAPAPTNMMRAITAEVWKKYNFTAVNAALRQLQSSLSTNAALNIQAVNQQLLSVLLALQAQTQPLQVTAPAPAAAPAPMVVPPVAGPSESSSEALSDKAARKAQKKAKKEAAEKAKREAKEAKAQERIQQDQAKIASFQTPAAKLAFYKEKAMSGEFSTSGWTRFWASFGNWFKSLFSTKGKYKSEAQYYSEKLAKMLLEKQQVHQAARYKQALDAKITSFGQDVQRQTVESVLSRALMDCHVDMVGANDNQNLHFNAGGENIAAALAFANNAEFEALFGTTTPRAEGAEAAAEQPDVPVNPKLFYLRQALAACNELATLRVNIDARCGDGHFEAITTAKNTALLKLQSAITVLQALEQPQEAALVNGEIAEVAQSPVLAKLTELQHHALRLVAQLNFVESSKQRSVDTDMTMAQIQLLNLPGTFTDAASRTEIFAAILDVALSQILTKPQGDEFTRKLVKHALQLAKTPLSELGPEASRELASKIAILTMLVQAVAYLDTAVTTLPGLLNVNDHIEEAAIRNAAGAVQTFEQNLGRLQHALENLQTLGANEPVLRWNEQLVGLWQVHSEQLPRYKAVLQGLEEQLVEQKRQEALAEQRQQEQLAQQRQQEQQRQDNMQRLENTVTTLLDGSAQCISQERYQKDLSTPAIALIQDAGFMASFADSDLQAHATALQDVIRAIDAMNEQLVRGVEYQRQLTGKTIGQQVDSSQQYLSHLHARFAELQQKIAALQPTNAANASSVGTTESPLQASLTGYNHAVETQLHQMNTLLTRVLYRQSAGKANKPQAAHYVLSRVFLAASVLAQDPKVLGQRQPLVSMDFFSQLNQAGIFTDFDNSLASTATFKTSLEIAMGKNGISTTFFLVSLNNNPFDHSAQFYRDFFNKIRGQYLNVGSSSTINLEATIALGKTAWQNADRVVAKLQQGLQSVPAINGISFDKVFVQIGNALLTAGYLGTDITVGNNNGIIALQASERSFNLNGLPSNCLGSQSGDGKALDIVKLFGDSLPEMFKNSDGADALVFLLRVWMAQTFLGNLLASGIPFTQNFVKNPLRALAQTLEKRIATVDPSNLQDDEHRVFYQQQVQSVFSMAEGLQINVSELFSDAQALCAKLELPVPGVAASAVLATIATSGASAAADSQGRERSASRVSGHSLASAVGGEWNKGRAKPADAGSASPTSSFTGDSAESGNGKTRVDHSGSPSMSNGSS